MGGEYWITDDGSVMFADGDIGDYNHEAYVIQTLQAQFAPDEFNRGEYVDWEGFEKALVAEAQSQLQPGQQLEDDPADIIYQKLKELGMTDDQINIAHGHGDARLFAMKNWGWKRMQGTNIETNTLSAQDINAIQRGVGEVLELEGAEEGEEPTFSIYVMANGLWFRGIPYSSLSEGDIQTFREGWGEQARMGVAWVRKNCKFAHVDPDPSELAKMPAPWGVLYSPPNPDGSRKKCDNCWMFLKKEERCLILPKDEYVSKTHVCGYHSHGTPLEKRPDFNITAIDPKLAGLVKTDDGTSCDICKRYENGHCYAVGTKDDSNEPAKVEAKGCCARWVKK